MNASSSFRFSLLAVGIALATGCAVNSAPDGERQANNGDDKVYSRTIVRINPDSTHTSDVSFVTKRAQIDRRDHGKIDDRVHAPSTDVGKLAGPEGKGKTDGEAHDVPGIEGGSKGAEAARLPVQTVVEACPGLEIWDGPDNTGNSVCFTSEKELTSAIDLAQLQRYTDCGEQFCFNGTWAGAVKSLKAGPQDISMSGEKSASGVTFKHESSVLVADPRLEQTTFITFIPTGTPDSK